MHNVFLAKEAAGAVQYKPVQAILKPVGIENADHKPAQHAEEGIRKKPERKSRERGPGQSRRQKVVSLDSKPLGIRLSPNCFIRSHSEERVTPALICRKHARGTGFSLWGLLLASRNPHRQTPVPRVRNGIY